MTLRTLRRKRVWIPALAGIALAVTAYATTGSGPRYREPSELPYTVAEPCAASLQPAPYYGTKVAFEESPQAAFNRAKRENKLVLLLHLSGRFGSSETT